MNLLRTMACFTPCPAHFRMKNPLQKLERGNSLRLERENVMCEKPCHPLPQATGHSRRLEKDRARNPNSDPIADETLHQRRAICPTLKNHSNRLLALEKEKNTDARQRAAINSPTVNLENLAALASNRDA